MPRLLHIEDDPANRLLVRKLLTPAGFEIVDAEDGIEGIRIAEQGNFDLILVDIAIPGLDGYEVTLKLRGSPQTKHTPIVAITAEGSRNTSLSVGCDGFLQKPINARTFALTLEGYLKGQREGISAEQSGEHLRAQSARIVSHLEEKLKEIGEQNSRLIELDQARTEFYRNISHELSTPMTPIVGYTKLLIDEELGQLNPAQLKSMKAVSECVNRLRSLIDNLLDVSGIETGQLRFARLPFLLQPAVEAAIAETSSLRESHQQRMIIEWPTETISEVTGDGRRVSRAISQLLENASKFSGPGSHIGLSLTQNSEGRLLITVADQGPGVDPALKERIFEPFFQADGSVTRAHGGTGVGLAVARGVARGHSGNLVLSSAESVQIAAERFHGAIFQLELSPRPE